jgi:hypothetical protein
MATGVPRGRLEVTVRDSNGAVVARRAAGNMVVRNGATVIARLFSGAADAQPINQLRLGFAKESGTPELKALTPPDGNIAPEALRSPLEASHFKIDTTSADAVQVSISATFHPTVDLDDVSEAGLFAGEDLYNHVVFEPISLKTGQDITFFWQVNFPFGH